MLLSIAAPEPAVEAGSEEEAPEGLEQLSEEEIQDIVKAEMFAEGEDEGSLVMDTLVAALAKDDGGITAQMLGKSVASDSLPIAYRATLFYLITSRLSARLIHD